MSFFEPFEVGEVYWVETYRGNFELARCLAINASSKTIRMMTIDEKVCDWPLCLVMRKPLWSRPELYDLYCEAYINHQCMADSDDNPLGRKRIFRNMVEAFRRDEHVTGAL
jgi:hypothetical protein